MVSKPSGSPAHQQRPTQRFSKASITAIFCGLAVFIPFLTGVIAVISGAIAIPSTGREGLAGRRWAVLGMGLGAVNLAIWSGILVAHFESAPIAVVAHQYIDNLAHSRLAAARMQCTDDHFDGVKVDADRINNHGTVTDIEVGEVHEQTQLGITTATASGFIGFNKAVTFNFQMSLLRRGGVWRVSSFHAYP